jgi:hypothetical protein
VASNEKPPQVAEVFSFMGAEGFEPSKALAIRFTALAVKQVFRRKLRPFETCGALSGALLYKK